MKIWVNNNSKSTHTTDGSDRNFTYSARLDAPIHIFGLERISGDTQSYRWRWGVGADFGRYQCVDDDCKEPKGYRTSSSIGTIWDPDGQDKKLHWLGTEEKYKYSKLLEFARYHIESSLLGLDSIYKNKETENSIYVNGITLSSGQKRNHGAAQINVAQFGAASSEDDSGEDDGTLEDRDDDNTKVKVYDVKELGYWQNSADGMDIGSDNSDMSYVYSQIDDDSIKLEAKNQSVSEYTAIQGQRGGVIMASMYGVLRDPLEGCVVSNVYVPIVRSISSDEEKYWGYWSGLITNRNSDRLYQNSNADQPIPGGWSVNNLFVIRHTDDTKPSALTQLGWIYSIEDGKEYWGDFESLAFEPREGFQQPTKKRMPINLNHIDLNGLGTDLVGHVSKGWKSSEVSSTDNNLSYLIQNKE